MTARFVPVDIGADVSALPESERRALVKMIEAARVLDGLYLRQVWAGNEALLLELLADRSPLGQARLHAFLVNKGPWSQLDHQAPFLPGVPAKPEAANFYPAGATKAEVEAWMKALPEAERAAATGFFTTIRRTPDGKLVAVPYSVEYQGELARAAELLREAAAATTQPTLRAFLEKRAAAFLSQRLLRERRRLDGARRVARAHDRALRDLRRRLVRLQGRLRGVHRRAGREGDGEARPLLVGAAVARGPAADRPRLAQPEARRDGPDPRGGRRLLLRAGQQRRPDRRLQPARTTRGSSRRRAASA